MASGFFRTRQGGRFKKRDSGDLGIRAYKEQQSNIIQATKEAKASAAFFASQQLQGLQSVGQSDIENQRILQEFRTNKWNTKRQQTEVRKKTEGDLHKGRAKIFGEKSQWLQEWAPKTAKTFLKLGFGAEELYSRLDADTKFRELIESNKFQEAADYFADPSKKVDEDILAARNKAFADKDIQAAEYLEVLQNSSNRFLSEKIANHIIERGESFTANLKQFITRDGGENEWTAEAVPEYYKMRARELVRQFGLTGQGASRVIAYFDGKAGEESTKLADYDRLLEDSNKRAETARSLPGFIGGTEAKNQINSAVLSYIDHPYSRNSEKGTIFLNNNPKEAGLSLFRDVVATGKITDYEQFKTDFLDSCIPGTSGDACTTWKTKHDGKGLLSEQLDELIVKGKKALGEKAKLKTEAGDANGLDVFTRALNGTGEFAEGKEKADQSLAGDIDSNKFEIALGLYKEAKDNNWTKTQNEIGKYLLLGDKAKNITPKQESFLREALAGNTNAAMFIWRDIDQKNRTQEMKEKFDILRVVSKVSGEGGTPITTAAEGNLARFASSTVSLTGQKTLSEFEKRTIVPYVEATFYHYLNREITGGKHGTVDEIIKNNKARDIVTTAWELTNEDIKSGTDGEGLFSRQTAEDGKTRVWTHFDTSKIVKERPNLAIISEAVLSSEGDLDNEKILNLIPSTQMASVAKAIVRGIDVELPYAVTVAYEVSNKKISKKDFVNSLLKKHGYGFNHAEDKEKPWRERSSEDQLTLKDSVTDITDVTVKRVWGNNPNIKINDRNAVPLNVYTSLVNQTSQMPMPDYYRFNDFKNALQSQYPDHDFSDIKVNPDESVVVGSGESYKILVKNRHKLGLRFEPLPNGNFKLVSKSRALYQIDKTLDQVDKTLEDTENYLNQPWVSEFMGPNWRKK